MVSFQLGAFVILKDGGRPMKVERIGADANGRTKVHCTWFQGNVIQQGEFLPSQLRPYAPEPRDVANPPLGS